MDVAIVPLFTAIAYARAWPHGLLYRPMCEPFGLGWILGNPSGYK